MNAKTLSTPSSFDPLAAMGIDSLWQSLFFLPSGYVDISNVIERFDQLDFNAESLVVRGKVLSVTRFDRNHRETRSPFPAYISLLISDGQVSYECTSYNATAWNNVYTHDIVTFKTKPKHNSYKGWHFSTPEIVVPSIIPQVQYVGVPKCSGAVIEESIQSALADSDSVYYATEGLRTHKPALFWLIEKHWGNAADLLLSIHQPTTYLQAVRALHFAKHLSIKEVKLNARRSSFKLPDIACEPRLRRVIWESIKTQPETLSSSQIDALRTCVPVLSGTTPARILLNGDVGTGKTLVFLSIVAGFASLGKYCAIMAPNESVANQIYLQFISRFPTITTNYLSGKSKGQFRNALVWIGTTALLFKDDRPSFDLVVCDEQQKFSREQREALLSPHSHLIEASATPIPRSLAMAFFSGCTLAKIASPPVTRTIRSHLIGEENRSMVKQLHHKAINSGGKVIYLYATVKAPTNAVDDSNTPISIKVTGTRALVIAFETMNSAFPGRVAIVHGKMKSEDAALELEDFRNGTKPILLASTSVEVGVDVPDIRLMVVSDPDRFGINQLHQIRGRLARNGGDADFVMHSTKILPKISKERLLAVKNIQDGFLLAEKDLEIRGFGEVAGDAQSGATNTTFKLCKLTASDFLR